MVGWLQFEGIFSTNRHARP